MKKNLNENILVLAFLESESNKIQHIVLIMTFLTIKEKENGR